MKNFNIKHIATLSRLYLQPEEEQAFEGIFHRILQHFEDLSHINTDNIQPLYHYVEQMPLRVDNPQNLLTIEQLMNNAPSSANQSFQLPKFLSE